MDKVCFHKGKITDKVLLISSCPGREEMKYNRLVAGKTGKNMDVILRTLNKKLPEIFPSGSRYDYCLSNSSENIHFKARDGKSTPPKKEILEPENLRRIETEIAGKDIVICFGADSRLALENVNRCADCRFAFVDHLSLLRLNTKYSAKNGYIVPPGSQGTVRRLELVADEILRQLNN